MSTHPPALSKPAVAAVVDEHDALPAGTRFGEFEIVRVLGVGGFGIVYLAQDHSLERPVALKEYMPASLAARGTGPQITVRSSAFAETYAIGLRSFINEARLLARFDHPSLVKVYRFWEDNATAYMVMPYLQGTTLRDARRRLTHAPAEAWIRSVVAPILSALELLHREGVFHRDVAPDNILLPKDGPPVLLDFGAARRVISDRTQSLTAILKPSYAPIEQYAEMTQLRQGPWTDLYALGAVVHYLVHGTPPPPATARAVAEEGQAPLGSAVPGLSPRFLDAMRWMLAVRPNERPQSVADLRAVLDGDAEVPAHGRPLTLPGIPAALPAQSPAVALDLPPRSDAGVAPASSMQPTVFQATTAGPPAPRPAAAPPASVPPSVGAAAIGPTRRRVPWIALGAGAALVLAAAAALQLAGPRRSAGVDSPGPESSAAGAVPIAGVPSTVPVGQSTSPSELIIESPEVASSGAPAPRAEPAARPAQAKVAPLAAPAPVRERDARTPVADRPAAADSADVPPSADHGRPAGRPVPRSADANPPRGEAVPARRPASRSAPAPATAREACAGKGGFIARAVCIDERCEEPQFRAVGECPAILARKHQREH